MTPRVSVCIAVCNEERYLEEAVRSILSQTFRDFEIVIVDDGSTDGTAALLETLASGDSRIRVFCQENSGLMCSLNRAVRESRGELIARMDGDDVSEPERLALQVEFLDAHPDVVAVGCQVLWTDPDGAALRRNHHPLEHEEIDELLLRGEGWAIQHATCVIRKNALDRIGGYREEFLFSEDLDLLLRLAEVGRMANLPGVLYRYRQHGRSICHAKRKDQKVYHDRILEEAFARRGIEAPDELLRFRGENLADGDQHRIWGWWALNGGNVQTARKHAWISLREYPLRKESWRLLICALRGR